MNHKAEKLLPRIQKAGVKACLKAGHELDVQELRQLKVQVVPSIMRWSLGALSVASACGSCYAFYMGAAGTGAGLALAAVGLGYFAMAGVRRTLGKILDSMSAVDAAELVGAALEGIGTQFSSLGD